jgi:hypothetical protein
MHPKYKILIETAISLYANFVVKWHLFVIGRCRVM